VSSRGGTVLFLSDGDTVGHRPPPGHPDSVERVEAATRGAAQVTGVRHGATRRATVEEIALVHTREYISSVHELDASGGGWLDEDTFASVGTYDAAAGAVGSGLVAIERLKADSEFCSAFVATRPPGHHASEDAGAGFCVFNNIAIAAAHLTREGSRVAIIDWDAHHGNGTQEIFWYDESVLYVSIHQEAAYPGTGYPHERGPHPSNLTTVNLPLPQGTTGEHYLRLFDGVIEPIVRRFEPDWILVSCGFDGHVDDPLSELALESHDFGLFARRVLSWVPSAGRTVFFLEGGYDLEALQASTAAVLTSTTNPSAPESEPSSGGPGAGRVEELRRFWASR
jgi:acetoin utilization deacetylase AcuC-like enzyme